MVLNQWNIVGAYEKAAGGSVVNEFYYNDNKKTLDYAGLADKYRYTRLVTKADKLNQVLANYTKKLRFCISYVRFSGIILFNGSKISGFRCDAYKASMSRSLKV